MIDMTCLYVGEASVGTRMMCLWLDMCVVCVAPLPRRSPNQYEALATSCGIACSDPTSPRLCVHVCVCERESVCECVSESVRESVRECVRECV